MHQSISDRQGFSLVELSIVLVILGLLVGGILSGQSLIRASELRSVSSEYSKYYTAVQSFRDRYFGIPGDLTNATAFWGKDNANCAGDSGNAATPGTCNGDGDALPDAPAIANSTGEVFQFWKQLGLAGLIEGNYSGLAGPSSVIHCVIGTNCPTSKMSSGTWFWQTAGTGTTYYAGNASLYAGNYGNILSFGKNSASTGPTDPILSPEEAWNVDTKLDDGVPGTGKMIIRYWSTCATATSATDFTAPYRLSDSTKQCTVMFMRQF